MNVRHKLAVTLTTALALFAISAPTAPAAKRTYKKMMWGPIVKDGRSQWPIYQDLGVGIYAAPLNWNEIATHRPLDPTNPNDPAYAWPALVDRATREAPALHIRINLMVIYSPSWANGGRTKNYGPDDPADYA